MARWDFRAGAVNFVNPSAIGDPVVDDYESAKRHYAECESALAAARAWLGDAERRMNDRFRQRMAEADARLALNKGRCIGGPHDGDVAACDGDHFIVELLVHPDVRDLDGTVSRVIEYDTYRWDGKCWRWGSQ